MRGLLLITNLQLSRPARTGSVLIEGAIGLSALELNGVYEVTKEVCGGMSVFQKKTNKDRWLEYFDYKWYVRLTSTQGGGKSVTLAYNTVVRQCEPQDCAEGTWLVEMKDLDVWEYVPSMGVCSLQIEECFVPLVVLVRAGVVTPFVARALVFHVLGEKTEISQIFDSILFLNTVDNK